MAITVDALELTVKTSADSAATSVSSLTQALEGLKGKYGSISALARSVTALKESAKGGMRLSSAATQIQNFGETVSRSINQSRIGKLNDLARAIKKLKTASSDFRMPGLSAIEGIRNAAKQGSATINNSQNNYKSAASVGTITEAVRKEASATKAETAAIKEQAHAVDELASRKAEWIAYQQEKHYRTGGKEGSARPVWSKEAEAADPVRPIKEIYNGDKKPDPIDLPESMYDALEMKAKGLGEVAEAAADAGNKLKTANATISGLKTTNEMENIADGDK